MGGADKGLLTFRGKPMVAHVIERFAPQVDELLISANRDIESYRAFGYRVISDQLADYPGPLAGLERALALARHPLVASVPCDTPFLPLDLVARLMRALQEQNAQVAVATTSRRTQPVFCLARREMHEHLRRFLEQGGRKMDLWYAALQVVQVAFEDADAFHNINTIEELRSAEAASDAE